MTCHLQAGTQAMTYVRSDRAQTCFVFFIPTLTACLHQEQLIATISLLWKENFCWKPWGVRTRDRKFKTTSITGCMKSKEVSRARTEPTTQGNWDCRCHARHLHSPPSAMQESPAPEPSGLLERRHRYPLSTQSQTRTHTHKLGFPPQIEYGSDMFL